MLKTALFSMMIPAAAFAADPNFLTPQDLPAKAPQMMGMSGRGKMPDIKKEESIAEALRANTAAGI
ncbi:MAG: hypothetical protein ACXVA8_14140, partial [Bdellovibrionota bacterium]